MSKNPTDQKTEKQTEATEPVVLNDKVLGDVAGGASSLSPTTQGGGAGSGFSPERKGRYLDIELITGG